MGVSPGVSSGVSRRANGGERAPGYLPEEKHLGNSTYLENEGIAKGVFLLS